MLSSIDTGKEEIIIDYLAEEIYPVPPEMKIDLMDPFLMEVILAGSSDKSNDFTNTACQDHQQQDLEFMILNSFWKFQTGQN